MTVIALQFPSPWTAIGSFAETGALLVLLLLFVLLYILTRNYLRIRSERFHPELQAGEEVLEQLTTNRWLAQTENVLTNQRIFQFHKHWFLSWRLVYSLALQDATMVSLQRGIVLYLLLLAILLLGFRPLALVLFLLAMERRRYAIYFHTHTFWFPWPRVIVQTFFPRQLGPLDHFYRRAQLAWAARRVERGLPASIQDRAIQETDLQWGRAVWIAVGVYALAAILQRTLEPHYGRTALAMAAAVLVGAISRAKDASI